jgi:hypothetical protein
MVWSPVDKGNKIWNVPPGSNIYLDIQKTLLGSQSNMCQRPAFAPTTKLYKFCFFAVEKIKEILQIH